jgi:hypothetical protein
VRLLSADFQVGSDCMTLATFDGTILNLEMYLREAAHRLCKVLNVSLGSLAVNDVDVEHRLLFNLPVNQWQNV